LPSRTRFGSATRVGDEPLVDGVADAPLERPHRVLVGLAFGAFAVVVGAAGGVVGELGDRRDVDRVVDLTVAFEVEPIMRVRSLRRGDGRGCVVAGVVILRREPLDVTGVAEHVRGHDRADAVHIGDGRFRPRDRGDDPGP
jgi:hypothetical protein